MNRRKKERREQAAERQATYDALPLQRRLDITTERSFSGLSTSKRETTRLLAQERGAK